MCKASHQGHQRSAMFYRVRFVQHFALLNNAHDDLTDEQFRTLAANLVNGLAADPLIRGYLHNWSIKNGNLSICKCTCKHQNGS